MTNIDQFESVFRSANKEQFAPERIEIKSVLVVTDLDRSIGESIVEEAQRLLSRVNQQTAMEWSIFSGGDYGSPDDLPERIWSSGADLICTYRCLKNPSPRYPYSLGAYLDVMTQATDIPVLVLPRPDLGHRSIPANTDSVMVMTDHLTGDHHLVSYAAWLTQPQGTMWLCHVEDETQFQRYIDTISRIPSLDTDTAREAIADQLLKEPLDYISSCRQVLNEHHQHIDIEAVVRMGHHLKDYVRLVEEHHVDVLVMNTKDEDQLAMHGLAYPLTIEIRRTPLLLL